MRKFHDLKVLLGQRPTSPSTASNPDAPLTDKDGAAVDVRSNSQSLNSPASLDAADGKHPETGELGLEEDAKGGMGRHLGVFSTTFLM